MPHPVYFLIFQVHFSRLSSFLFPSFSLTYGVLFSLVCNVIAVCVAIADYYLSVGMCSEGLAHLCSYRFQLIVE